MKPKIFVFCNNCAPEWHSVAALSEDGCFIAGHVCSHHAYINDDMGFTSDWKHKSYNRHYPDGWELVFVEDARNHSDLDAAHKRHLAWGKDAYKERMAVHDDGPETPSVQIEFSE